MLLLFLYSACIYVHTRQDVSRSGSCFAGTASLGQRMIPRDADAKPSKRSDP